MPPAWQEQEQHARTLAPRWVAAAFAAFFVCAAVLLGARQGYVAPPRVPAALGVQAPPEPMPPALAGALLMKGRGALWQAMAALVDLADRGDVEVVETPGHLGSHKYDLILRADAAAVEEHQRAVRDIVFGGPARPATVTLGTARSRLARRAKPFSAAVERDLGARGLLDPARQAARNRLNSLALTVLLAGAAGCIAGAMLIHTYGLWPYFVPAAVVAAGVTGLVMGAGMTALTDEGVARAAAWRGFGREVDRFARHPDDRVPPSTWLAYAMAMGRAALWASYLNKHQRDVPSWFHAAAGSSGHPASAFSGFVVLGGASSTAGGGGSGAGAAGGGGSGAA
ncbi:MAG: hypothetical protein DMF86_16320 [Acidobacteria bacterium]|nr:MAG: hypothetical protein DMF86_16320 [Acidobacteriota bacterium]